MSLTDQAKNLPPRSLESFWGGATISDEGIVHFQDGRSSFTLRLTGLDPNFLTESDWESLSVSWRSLLKLSPKEEVQINFTKDCQFDEIISKKIRQIGLVENKNAKALLLKNVNNLLEDVDPQDPRLFSTKILWTYTQIFQAGDLPNERSRILNQKRRELIQVFDEGRVRAQELNRSETEHEIFTAANGSNYVSNGSATNDWPKVEIFPSEVIVENRSFRCLSLQKLPEQSSTSGMILALTSIPASFELAIRFQGKDSKQLYDSLDRKRKVLFGLLNKRGATDLAADSQYKELTEVLSRINNSNDCLLHFGLTIGIRADKTSDIVQRWALNEFLNAQNKMGFLELSEPYLASFDAFLEMIPTFRGYKMATQTLLASNGVHFVPLFQTHKGDSKAVATYRTLDGGLFSIDPSNYRNANFNWLISGTSGSGKSFFVNSILLQSQSLNPRIFIVDVGGSYAKLTQYLGGKLVGFDAQCPLSISPFFLPKSDDPIAESRRREHIQIVFWEMMRDQDQTPSIEEKAILKEVLTPFFEANLLSKNPVSAVRAELVARGMKRLALLLDRWCAPSFYGNFIDSNATLEFDDRLITFDLKGLNDFGDLSRVVQLIICSGLWATIQKNTARFGFVVLDEVAFTLLKAQPSFVDELISTVRKYNTSVIVITQDLEKITSNSAGASILQNTQVKAILQQRGDPKNFAEPLQLTEEDLTAIRRLSRRKGSFSDIFLLVDERRIVIRYAPNLFEYMLSTSVPQENRSLEAKMSQHSGSYSEKFIQTIEAMTK